PRSIAARNRLVCDGSASGAYRRIRESRKRRRASSLRSSARKSRGSTDWRQGILSGATPLAARGCRPPPQERQKRETETKRSPSRPRRLGHGAKAAVANRFLTSIHSVRSDRQS